jgi:hypothetical protein
MFAHVRMIGGGLDRDVERDLEAMPSRGLDKTIEVFDRPEARFDRHVAALLRSDGPRTAGIAGPWREAVVRALSEAAADGMDWRKVQDVETHRRDVGQPRRRFVEGGAASRIGASRTRKHLVPGAEARPLGLHEHLEHAVESRRQPAVRIRGHPSGEIGRTRHGDAEDGGCRGIGKPFGGG